MLQVDIVKDMRNMTQKCETFLCISAHNKIELTFGKEKLTIEFIFHNHHDDDKIPFLII